MIINLSLDPLPRYAFVLKYINHFFAGDIMIEITILLNEEKLGLYALQGTSKLSKFKVHEMLQKLIFLPPHYIIATSQKKSLLYLWNMSQDSSVQKYVLPGLPLTVAASPCGTYIAVGIDNTVRFWHLPSGQLVKSVSGHYQKVSSLVWSFDGSLVISGGHDNNVNVWEVHKLFREDSSVSPLYTFTDHSMPVTDIYCGLGGFKSRLFTSSLDNTCNIYELCSGKIMLSLEFPAPIFKLLVNRCESMLYAVSVSTEVYKVSLVSPPNNDVSKQMKVFIKCPNKITSCCLTDEDSAIILGSSQGDLIKYSSSTGQVLPFSFKSRSPVDDVLSVTLPSYKRNDKSVPFPYQQPLQRVATGVLEECSLHLQPRHQPIQFVSDSEFLDLVKEAVAEEKGADNVSELKDKIGELSALSEQLVKFVSDQLIGS